MDKILFSDRLSKLRKKRGYESQYALAKAYNDKFPPKRRYETAGNDGNFGGIFGTIKNYENPNHEGSPKLSIVCNLCEILDCDLDYLLGKIDVPRHETADVMAVTGLSAGAVENMKKYDERVVTYISFLLETGLINRTGLKAAQCIDTRLEISHYERDVLPSLTIPPEDEKRAWRECKFSDSYLDMASKRTKVLDEIQRLKEVYDARLWRCCKDADEAVVDFIDKEVDKWLTSKNVATKTAN